MNEVKKMTITDGQWYDERIRMFERGKREGRESLQKELRALLGIDEEIDNQIRSWSWNHPND